jgi:hypothetical protein
LGERPLAWLVSARPEIKRLVCRQFPGAWLADHFGV